MGQSFSKGGGMGWIWTWAIAVIAQSFNRWARIWIFFRVSVYLWLLSLLSKNFLLVKKVGWVCGMSYLFYIMKSFVPLCYYLFIIIIFLNFLFLLLFLYLFFVNVCDQQFPR